MLRSLQTKKLRKATPAAVCAIALGVVGCGVSQQFGLAGQTSSFGQAITYNTKVDVLVVVANSGSMASKQIQLSQGFVPFINFLNQSGYDYRLAVTTMDMSGSGAQGAFVGSPKVLSQNIPNVASAFINNVSQGQAGSDLLRGFQAFETALGPSMVSGVNAGFLRSDALLALVFMSPEDDFSAGQPSDYVSFLNQLKPNFPSGQMAWIANSIIVTKLNDPACTTFGTFSSVGLRYQALSQASNGVVESICSPDLVSASQDIMNRVVSILTAYHIPLPADPTTIQVFINGQAISQGATNGWTFDPATNVVTFHGSAVPPAGATVQVSYKPTGVSH